MTQFFNAPEDIRHFTDIFSIPGTWGAIIVHGDECAPDRIECWATSDPEFDQEADAVLYPPYDWRIMHNDHLAHQRYHDGAQRLEAA